jgi:hypothetical protein
MKGGIVLDRRHYETYEPADDELAPLVEARCK